MNIQWSVMSKSYTLLFMLCFDFNETKHFQSRGAREHKPNFAQSVELIFLFRRFHL